MSYRQSTIAQDIVWQRSLPLFWVASWPSLPARLSRATIERSMARGLGCVVEEEISWEFGMEEKDCV